MQKIILTLGLFLSVNFAFSQDTPVGQWKTIDDETHKVESIVEISENNGKLTGKILQIFPGPGEAADPKCDKCSGDKKDQPIIGMTILTGMEKRGQEWTKGKILDPDNGKTYGCNMKVISEGKKLEVRGFIGISLFGRTQVWERVEN